MNILFSCFLCYKKCEYLYVVEDQGAFAPLKEKLRFSEPSRVLVPESQRKNTRQNGCFFLADDQGAFAPLKGKLRFSEPSRVLVPGSQRKNTRKTGAFSWWTIRVFAFGKASSANRRSRKKKVDTFASSREPWIIRRFLVPGSQRKNTRKTGAFSWWTIRDSNPGPID